MKLSDLFPKEELLERIQNTSVTFTEYGMEDLDKFVAKKSGCMFELGAASWDKFMQTSPGVNPMILASYFQANDPYLFREVNKYIGCDSIKDLYYVTAEITDSSVEYSEFSELLISVLHPRTLHISDVEFSNPYRPIPKHQMKYTLQPFEGLGLFKVLLERCVQFCKSNNLEKICLTAAHVTLIPYFEKYGFTVDDTPLAKQGIAMGSGIPMTLVID